jgi:hypothetical protein
MAKVKPEQKIKRRVTALLNQLGTPYFCPIGGVYSKSGVSDIIACCNGRMLCIEAKADAKKKLTPMQLQFHESMAAAGAITLVVCDDETLETLRTTLCQLQQNPKFSPLKTAGSPLT